MSIICIKIGGSTLDTPGIFQTFSQAVALLAKDHFPVIVHGGGKDIARQLDLQKKEYRFVEGMRVTDEATVGVVQMVLSGDVNKRLANALQVAGVSALGISGVDCGLFTASRMTVGGQDIGFVGAIDNVDTRIIDICKEQHIVPVVSPISRDTTGNTYNVNADTAAAEIARALRADHLVFVSDVPGVLINGSVAHSIPIDKIEAYIADGQVKGGMIPKLRGARKSIETGVANVHICGFTDAKSLLSELTPATASGTIIHK
jgi:acetylglutamate kinase